MRGAHAEFRKLSPSLEWECSEDEARHRLASEILKRPVVTWRTLTLGELRRLKRAMAERSGSMAAYRAEIIARLAVELWGEEWDQRLRHRVIERFAIGRLAELAPRDARAMIEELKSRIGRKPGARSQKSEARIQELDGEKPT